MVAPLHDERNVEAAAAEHRRATSGSIIVVAFGALVILVALYFVLGMPGMDHTPTQPAHDMENMQPAVDGGLLRGTVAAPGGAGLPVRSLPRRNASAPDAGGDKGRAKDGAAVPPSSSAPTQVTSTQPTPPSTATEPSEPVTTPASDATPISSAPPIPAPPTSTALEPGFVGMFDPPLVAVGQSSGEDTKIVQLRLLQLGFWNSGPDGRFGLTTTQSVMAFQKYIGLAATGAVDEVTAAYLTNVAHRARGRTDTGNLIEIDKQRQLLFIVRDGVTLWTLNTSTGNGLPYDEPDKNSPGEVQRGVALTPDGLWKVDRERPEGWWEGDLGEIYRPKYFRGGIAVHGSNSVPNYPASHGCVRVTVPAMDMIWDQNFMPIGTTVWVHAG